MYLGTSERSSVGRLPILYKTLLVALFYDTLSCSYTPPLDHPRTFALLDPPFFLTFVQYA